MPRKTQTGRVPAVGLAASLLLLIIAPQAALAKPSGGGKISAVQPTINATQLTIYAGQTKITIVGSFPKLKSSWNITLRASGPKTVPQPVATVFSVAGNGKSAVLAIQGLANYHKGTLLAKMFVNSRTHQFSTEYITLGAVVEAPVVYFSDLKFSSSIQTVIVYGEGLMSSNSTNNITTVVELAVGRSQRQIPVTITHQEDQVAMLSFPGSRLTNRDTGPVIVRFTVNNASSEFTQIGAVDIGRLPLAANHSLLRQAGGGNKLGMTFGVAVPREIPTNYVGPEPKIQAAKIETFGLGEKVYRGLMNWVDGDVDFLDQAASNDFFVPNNVVANFRVWDVVKPSKTTDGDDGKEQSSDDGIPETGFECAACGDQNLFECKNGGAKIPFCWVCDGRADCSDGSDESACGQHECQGVGELEKSLIPQSWICDGLPDCEDKSDESQYGCNTAITCQEYYVSDEFLEYYGMDGAYTTAEAAEPSTAAEPETATEPVRRRRDVEYDVEYESTTPYTSDQLELRAMEHRYESGPRKAYLAKYQEQVAHRAVDRTPDRALALRVADTVAAWHKETLPEHDPKQLQSRRREDSSNSSSGGGSSDEPNVLPSGNPFVGINVYLTLQLELPTQISLREKTCGNRVFAELYWDQDEVVNKYGSAADDFELDLVFTNIIDRKPLTSAAGKVSVVDCTRGFCGADIPNGQFRKKVEFFAGTFTEDYQLKNYPFDSQVFEFNFTLYSNLGNVAMYSPAITTNLDRSHGAYFMDTIECSSEVTDDGSFGICKMAAQRIFAPVVLNLLTPTMLFVFIAIFSLALDVKLAMPRVGSTLFALLILTQYRNAALANLPATSDFIWVDLFLFVCSFLVWTVLLLHIIADGLHQGGHILLQKSVDRTMIYGLSAMLVECVLIITFRTTAAIIVISVVMVLTVIIIIAFIIRDYRKRLRKAMLPKLSSRRHSSFVARTWSAFVGNVQPLEELDNQNWSREEEPPTKPKWMTSRRPDKKDLTSKSSTVTEVIALGNMQAP